MTTASVEPGVARSSMERGERRVLITGGGSGIGAAAARRLTADGWSVALLDARPAGIDEIASQLPPGSCVSFVADVTDERALAASVASAVEALGGLDGVVCAAGIARF